MPNPRKNPDVTRRALLHSVAGAATTGVAVSTVGAVGTVSAQSTGGPDYGGWFDSTSNYEGTVDRTGQEEVTITVGAPGNNGNYAFSPAAVRVDPGTTITWEWSGKGSMHNVVDESGSFESEMSDEAGHTFSYQADGPGVSKYACTPHKGMGMKGALVVGGTQANTGSGGGIGDLLAVGGGLGLTGILLAMVALGLQNETETPERTS